MKEIKITEAAENQRLDKFLLKYFNKSTKAFIYKMLRKKRIKYNNSRAQGSEIIKAGDTVQMYLSEETMSGFISAREIKQAEKNFEIVYEDGDILICNKPPGVIVHPDKNNKNDTLIQMLLYYLHQKGGLNESFTPVICNRLDRNTSGIVICAKNLKTAQEINEALKNNRVEKYYIALVKGKVEKPGVLKGYHIKDDSNHVKIFDEEISGSKPVWTEYTPIKVSSGFSLLQIKLITGRSHQIRAALKNINHPIIGDTKYGDPYINKKFKDRFNLNGQLLHAERIIFTGNNKYDKPFYARPPKLFENIIEKTFNM